MDEYKKIGLVLTGGGARAVYQVGVLDAIHTILSEANWPSQRSPFDIICGTSAGAMNAAAIACRSDDFGEAISRLMEVCKNFTVDEVYRLNAFESLNTGAKWLSLLSFGWELRKMRANPPKSLFDNTPSLGLMHRLIDFPRLDAALSSGILHALAISASSYSSGHNITFYQSAKEIEPWIRMQRFAQPAQIGIDHLLASAAIPLIFPAIPIFYDGHREYFGDGSMRQMSPISPAIHLGAEKMLVIAAGRLVEPLPDSSIHANYPSIAQITGHAMSSIFLDSLAVDIERLNRINATLSNMSEEGKQKTKLRTVETLIIAPSERLDVMANRHVTSLPPPIRKMLNTIGVTDQGGGALVSYLLFESSYTCELIKLGQHDTFLRRADVLAFFGAERRTTARETDEKPSAEINEYSDSYTLKK